MGRPKNFSREEVLGKAMPVFWRHGFADTTLQDLEQATGVNKAGLYTDVWSAAVLQAKNGNGVLVCANVYGLCWSSCLLA